MASIAFTMARALATRDVQSTLAAAPTSWVWKEKTVAQWTTDVTELDQLFADESAKRTQWRVAAEQWEEGLIEIQQITRDVARNGAFHFRADTVKGPLFEQLQTDGQSRADIFEQGQAARDVWQEADAAWTYDSAPTLAYFSSLLVAALAKQGAHSAKLVAWRKAASALVFKARTVDQHCVAWYAEATRKFAEGTTEGDLIRSAVPVTTRPEEPVGQAVISNVMVSVNDIHFDVAALHATRFTFLQQAPNSPVFAVVLADSPQTSLTLHNQAAGTHQFKVIGSNSNGQGPESAVAVVTVAQNAVA